MLTRFFTATVVALWLCSAAWSAVLPDANSTSVTTAGGAGATSITDTGKMTVGSGSNRVLVAVFGFLSPTVPLSLAATWNGVSMTQVASASNVTGSLTEVIFCLANPASGAQALSATWTPPIQTYMAAVSFTGADQTGGATTCPNGNANTGNATSASIAITSATGDMVVGVAQQDGGTWGTVSGSTIFSSTALTANAAANYDNGAATVNLTAAINGGAANFSYAGVDVKAAGGGGATAKTNTMMLLGVGP